MLLIANQLRVTLSKKIKVYFFLPTEVRGVDFHGYKLKNHYTWNGLTLLGLHTEEHVQGDLQTNANFNYGLEVT